MKTSLKLLMLLAATAISISSCRKDDDSTNTPEITSMKDLRVESSFQFASAKNFSLTLQASLPNTAPDEKFLFTVYDKSPDLGGNMLDRGMADANGRYVLERQLPTALESVYVTLRSSLGRTEARTINVSGSTTTEIFTQGAVGNPIAGRTANTSPTCSSGCGLTLNASTNNGYNIPNNTTLCIPEGITLGGTITLNSGSRIRVCGTLNAQNINLNGGARLHMVITTTGRLNMQNINMNSSGDSIINYGSNFVVTGNLNGQGFVGNYGFMSIGGQFNNNSNAYFHNYTGARLGVTDDFNNNQRVINDGTITILRNFVNNGSADFTNNCRMTVGRNFSQNNIFQNFGYVGVTESTDYNGRSVTTYGSGSLWITRDAQINGTLSGQTSGYAKLKVSTTTRINGGARITGQIDVCDATGIETLNITLPSSVTTNCSAYIPATSCNPGDGVPTVVDTDRDGAPDSIDEYPNDPNKAFNSYYPAQNVFGTHAFEDTWPAQADYDFNDLVIGYNYKMVRNADNNFVEVEARYKVRAFGAQLNNGFAVSFPFSSSAVDRISGTRRAESFISDNARGFEDGHAGNTVIVVADAINSLYGAAMQNTVPGRTNLNTDTIAVVMTLSTPQASIGTAPFDPFLIVDKERGKEIHLVNQAPTKLAKSSYFGTNMDRSVPSSRIYYRTANNLPWAIDLPTTFRYPVEYVEILKGHLKFVEWARSGGRNLTDWYMDKPGYRDNTKLY